MKGKCSICGSPNPEVELPYAKLKLCPKCFKNFFVRRVVRTVKKYHMFGDGDYVGVAVSGGKDSAALLHALRRGFPNQRLVAIHVNLGIKGYSQDCEDKARKLAERLGVKLIVYDLRREEGFTIDDLTKTPFKRRICGACGVIKRYLFNMLAYREGVDVLVTGHNLDDTLVTLVKMFLSGDFTQLSRIQPSLPKTHPRIVRRGKPLIRTPEHEALLYVGYNDLPVRRSVCPHSDKPLTEPIKAWIDEMEAARPGFKYQLLSSFLKMNSLLRETIPYPQLRSCKVCGFPTTSEVCSRCRIVEALRGVRGGTAAFKPEPDGEQFS